jgi:hypothetical protein
MAKSEDKLDIIINHLARMDKRDRLRMWGGAFKGALAIIPAIAFVYGMYYFYLHGDEVMAKIAKVAAEQAFEATTKGTEGIFNQLPNFKVK